MPDPGAKPVASVPNVLPVYGTVLSVLKADFEVRVEAEAVPRPEVVDVVASTVSVSELEVA